MKTKAFGSSTLMLYFLVLTGSLIGYPTVGQVSAKKVLQPEDYKLWHRFETLGISTDNKWVVYRSATDQSDTLIVQSTNRKKKYVFPHGSDWTFLENTHFVVQDGKGVTFTHLKTGKQHRLRADSFAKAGLLVAVFTKEAEHGRLELMDSSLNVLQTIKEVVAYKSNPKNSSFAVNMITAEDGVYALSINRMCGKRIDTRIVTSGNSEFSNFTWSDDGRYLAFLRLGTDGSFLCHFDAVSQKLNVLQSGSTLPDNIAIATSFPLHFSADCRRLFFKGRYKDGWQRNSAKAVQVWNAEDKWIYPGEQIVMGFTKSPHLMMWEPEQNQFLSITDFELPHGMLTPDEKHAIVYNPKTYEPQFKEYADRDLYLFDLSTGNKRLLLTKQPRSESRLVFSPDDNKIAYFREGHWYVYDMKSAAYSAITTKLRVSFHKEKQEWFDESIAYGCAGWTQDGLYLLLYDQFDLWKAAVDGSHFERLTQGREKEMVYRLLMAHDKSEKQEYMLSQTPAYDLRKGLLLTGSSLDDSINGLYKLHQSLQLEQLYEANKRIYDVIRQGNSSLAWIAESYTNPPQLMFKASMGKSNSIVISNRHESKYSLRKMEVLEYNAPTGKKLRGLLYYPADYKTDRYYPMITHVYEVQSTQVHHHLMPSLKDGEGFNVSHYVAKGYFILLPDIAYEKDLAGKSALLGVNAAVDAALQVAQIDPNRIGLIGHSFGGYETNYIITQTNRFACAVAGAAITDFISAGLAVARNEKRPNLYKLEQGQTRMSTPVTEKRESYIDNSPIFFVKDIQTPLLAWTGLEDTQVEWTQSFEMYMAMRRMGKRHILLGYPEQGHELEDADHIADLNQKIGEWFDHYLMGFPKVGWMDATK